MAASGHVSKVRALYKRILVLHRFLPVDLKALGDQYVKTEFRRHKGVSPGEAKSFMAEWQKYKDSLQTQVLDSAGKSRSSAQFGSNLSEEELGDFQDEQVGQLYELMLESTKPSRQFSVREDGE